MPLPLLPLRAVRGLQQRAAEQEHSKGEAVAESASDAEQERSGQEEMPAMDPTLEPAAEFTVYVRQLVRASAGQIRPHRKMHF